jgi:3-oxoacyl-(acyl-carrier-protein) synthase III
MTGFRAGGMTGFGVLGMGVHLPDRVVDNAAVAAACGCDPAWIEERTGVLSRHIAAPAELTSDLAAGAGAKAMADTGVLPDLLVLATVTPDRPLPATAYDVQRKLDLPGVPAFTVDAACSGFLHAIAVGWGASRTGIASTALLIGADVFTRQADPTDRRAAPLFGDAAAALMFGPVPDGYGVLAVELWGDGRLADIARIDAQDRRGARPAPLFTMDGQAVSRTAMEYLPWILARGLERAAVEPTDLARLIVHQANVRLVERIASVVGLPPERVPTSGRHTGNTATASVPLTLALSHADRPLRRDDLVALVAVGAGASAGAAVLRWY